LWLLVPLVVPMVALVQQHDAHGPRR
jgi:hypothetical protein